MQSLNPESNSEICSISMIVVWSGRQQKEISSIHFEYDNYDKSHYTLQRPENIEKYGEKNERFNFDWSHRQQVFQ